MTVPQSQLNVPDETYQRLFATPDGANVLQELALLFYDADLVVPGDDSATMQNIGKREVVRYLMARAAQ